MSSLDRLKVTDLQKVQSDLWNARTRWRNLGDALGIHASSIDSIAMKHREDPVNCFREMLSEWLRGGSTPPRTWNTLVAALRMETVDLGSIADEIERKYKLIT